MSSPPLGIRLAARSDVGMRRSNNQDSFTTLTTSAPEDWKAKGHFLMVADGMGAHAAGELASKLAVDGVPHLYNKHRELPPTEALERALQDTNTEIHRRGNANLDFRNMGTTASVITLLPAGAIVGHIGDSRVYRLRGNVLEQLTFDHSLVWELRAAGQLPEDAAEAGAIPKNVITRSLGPNAHVEVDVEGPFPIQKGDIYLLCSDGLTGQIEDADLGAILGNLAPDEAVQVLIDLANLRGGPDNITVIVAEVCDDNIVTTSAGAHSGVAPASSGPHPAAWFAALGLLILGGALMAIGQIVAGGVLAAGGAGVLAFALWKAFSGEEAGPRFGHRGKGPYTQLQCPVSRESVERLQTIVSDLRKAAKDERWVVDWDGFSAFQQQAEEAFAAGRHADAFRACARAISFMMEELRMQGGDAGDSSVQL